jgi:hypothetical protein
MLDNRLSVFDAGLARWLSIKPSLIIRVSLKIMFAPFITEEPMMEVQVVGLNALIYYSREEE